MRATVLHAPYDVRVEELPKPTITQPSDAIIRLAAACVCGSDLWPYRGTDTVTRPVPMGHEFAGWVDEVGADPSVPPVSLQVSCWSADVGGRFGGFTGTAVFSIVSPKRAFATVTAMSLTAVVVGMPSSAMGIVRA